MAKIVINIDDSYIDTVIFDGSKKIFIGRKENCDVHLDNISVSNRHASIYKEEDGFVIEDLNSTNGTIINDKLISKHILKDGEMIEISKYRMLFWEN